MKKANQFSIMMAVIVLSFSINSCDKHSGNDQNQQDIKTITLYVDTSNINQQNMDATCNFGQPAGVSNKDFTTYVELGDRIIWKGVSSSSPNTDRVKIKKIRYVSGSEILNSNVIRNSWFSSKVKGKVRNGKPEDIEKYSIEFKVIRNGNNERFIIDPKLQIGK